MGVREQIWNLSHIRRAAKPRACEKAGAHAGFLSGLIVSVIILFFVFEKVSKPLGLCEALFGVPSLGTGTPFKDVDPLVFAVPISLAFTLIVSALSAKPSAAHLAACFPDDR